MDYITFRDVNHTLWGIPLHVIAKLYAEKAASGVYWKAYPSTYQKMHRYGLANPILLRTFASDELNFNLVKKDLVLLDDTNGEVQYQWELGEFEVTHYGTTTNTQN